MGEPEFQKVGDFHEGNPQQPINRALSRHMIFPLGGWWTINVTFGDGCCPTAVFMKFHVEIRRNF
tara:strand:- start:170 stop:364 length:195 start_codon:yes stop_codon:yes gene_type:complete